MMIQTRSAREYGFIEEGHEKSVHMKKGQYVSGFSVGILFLDECWYPTVPGNVANLSTYEFPVVLKVVPGCTQERIHAGDPTLVDDVIRAARQFEAEGARVICGACGFFGNFQRQVAEAVDIPVYLSSMVQLPWVRTGLKASQSIAVLTADANGLNENLLKSCGIDSIQDVVIKDLSRLPEFSAIVESRGHFDNGKVRQEAVHAALEVLEEHPDVGAFLLECSDLPPYAADIQRAAGLPVYDFITMIRWAHLATAQKPYAGFI